MRVRVADSGLHEACDRSLLKNLTTYYKMNVLLLSLSNIGLEYIYFLETKKNILMEGFFSKILFFHPSFSIFKFT
jgi:hypothetical protein